MVQLKPRRHSKSPGALSHDQHLEYLEYGPAQTQWLSKIAQLALASVVACTDVAGRVSATYTPACGGRHYGLRRPLLGFADSQAAGPPLEAFPEGRLAVAGNGRDARSASLSAMAQIFKQPGG